MLLNIISQLPELFKELIKMFLLIYVAKYYFPFANNGFKFFDLYVFLH